MGSHIIRLPKTMLNKDYTVYRTELHHYPITVPTTKYSDVMEMFSPIRTNHSNHKKEKIQRVKVKSNHLQNI